MSSTRGREMEGRCWLDQTRVEEGGNAGTTRRQCRSEVTDRISSALPLLSHDFPIHDIQPLCSYLRWKVAFLRSVAYDALASGSIRPRSNTKRSAKTPA